VKNLRNIEVRADVLSEAFVVGSSFNIVAIFDPVYRVTSALGSANSLRSSTSASSPIGLLLLINCLHHPDFAYTVKKFEKLPFHMAERHQ